MAAPIDFYFDFSSPYGFLAAQKIEPLAGRYGRTVDWHPVLLGVIFRETGSAPLTTVPLKGNYSRRDFERSARFHGIGGFRMPPKFPIASQAPARIVLWQKARNPALATVVIMALYRAFFNEAIDISDPDVAATVAAKAGVDAAAARAAIDDPAVKDALKREVGEAIARGVFGSPFIIVDGEPFWGLDRLDQVERWLATGGF
ncbi:MAG: 2-hydroxychromene-2-carboxylate isomerase [Betaproteobacteria bacterium]|jgi:2-hydroxychromene-2-carboxylate isomerase|nr:2-hydroxychromene-2-carboxylate isomerase [Betaproteobacteria bacterium]